MRKIFTTIAVIVSCTTLFAQGVSVSYNQPATDTHQITFTLDKWSLDESTFDGVTYNSIEFSGSLVTEKKGWAELPFVSAAIQLPAQKNVDLKISSSSYKDYQLSYPLLPSRGIIYRNQNPDDIPYMIDPASIVDSFYPSDIAVADAPYIIRDVRGTSVHVYPFQYNAATNILRVYSDITVQLVENNEPATNPLLRENTTPVREMIGVYESLFLNFDKSRYDLPMAQHGDILVIYTSRDQDAIQPYITWKKEMGYNVQEELVATGTNVASLIQQKYNANPNLLYVQLVGDWADVKTNTVSGEPADPKAGCVVGTDNFPEIAVGRFSCNNVSQLTVQVNKTINYEKNPDMTGTWRSKALGIASNQGPGDDGELDYTHVNRIYNERLNPVLDYDGFYTEYDPSASASGVTTAVNAGVSTIAYTGHGSQTSWGTTGFSNSNVNSLSNGAKLPFITSVACNNGTFESGDCFAEAWLRKENGGAIVTWMSSISQPWQPPMRGQDYFYDVLIGGFNYNQYSDQSGINTTEQRTTWGAVVVNASNLMLTESQSSDDVETAHTWCTFGDASIQLRTASPAEVTVSNTVMLIGVPYTTTITTSDGPVANALVCISQNGQYFSGTTDENGVVEIEHSILPGEVLLVVTGFNLQTVYETINCISPDGAFLTFEAYQLDGDGILSYGETSNLSITLENVGNYSTNGTVEVTISSEDELLAINNATVTFDAIESHGFGTGDGFNITVSPEIEDGHVFTFNISATDADTTWTAAFSITAHKPVLAFSSLSWNGSYTPGETLELVVSIFNIGSYFVENVEGTLASSSEYVTINGATQSFGDIAVNGTASATYSVTISDNCPLTELIAFSLALSGDDGDITGEGSFTISNSCNLQFDLTDSYGDGWNNAALIVSFSDGSPSQSLTFSSGHNASFTLEVNSGTIVTLTWQSGSYDSECSFVVSYADNGVEIYSKSHPAAGFLYEFVMDCSVQCGGVKDLAATAGGGGTMNISWTAPMGDVDHYDIYRDDVLIATTTATSYTDEGLQDGNYVYCVVATFTDGCVGQIVCVEGLCADMFNMPTSGTIEITTCAGMLYDNGGPDANYSNNCNAIAVIHPGLNGAMAHITGTYDVENNWDYIYIYDGESASGNAIGTYTGTGSIDVVSTLGALTVKFTSDSSVNKPGFAFTLECEGGVVSDIPGDANGDMAVNITDIMTVINYMMEGNPETFIFENADVNSDGNISVLDIIGIVNIIVGQ
ncbi:MAG: hypothetical protein IKW93_03220 [Bacteroidales bacterium]|nr:hypothetical protein [Bacteroidales bacterium]